MADNTEEEHFEDQINNQSENPSNTITPSLDTETITQNQETSSFPPLSVFSPTNVNQIKNLYNLFIEIKVCIIDESRKEAIFL